MSKRQMVEAMAVFCDRLYPISPLHTVVEVSFVYGRPEVARFDSGLIVGESPYDGEWRLDWETFQKEMFCVASRDEVLNLKNPE